MVAVRILVPRREGFADRDRLWAYCRPWWQWRFPDWPVIEGHHTIGLFNRSAAINTAAALAGAWDVALVIDSDVILPRPESATEAVAMAHDTGRMVVAFDVRQNITRGGTERIIGGHEGDVSRWVQREYRDQHSAVVAIPRRLWDDIGGFDEGFTGWGLEDTAFALAAETFAGPHLSIPGVCWHLSHATAPEGKQGSPSHAFNVARAGRYRAAQALGDRDAIRALVAEGRDLEADRSVDAIPRTFHRVIPETTPAIAEDWWTRLGEMHPGWRMLTHRDPLDPADWPLTSPHWARVANGAQLADLVRLEALLRWGGFYVDMDVEPIRSFGPLLGAHIVAGWEDASVIPNAILGARPNHPAIRRCLDLAIRRMRRGTWEAGPGVTTRVLGAEPTALLLPPGTFYPVHYRDPERDRLMTEPAPPWTIARHHYWGSWLEPERRRVPA